MGWRTLEEQVLHKAVEVLGSERALARALRISKQDLSLFLSGAERPTRSVFLAACDILIDRGDVGLFATPLSDVPAPDIEKSVPDT